MRRDPRADRPGSSAEHALQEEVGTTERADTFYQEQVLDHLNPLMREFVARQEMFFLSTADRRGECDSTFRAGPPGFLHVLDAQTVAYPEYRGNGVMASLGNISENPHVGILLIDFCGDRIGLHINGRAEIRSDEAMRAAHPGLPEDPVPGRRPQMWVEVTVVEAYIHCSKHIPRMAKVPSARGMAWGTDDVKRKGGDFFGAAAGHREERARREAAPEPPRVARQRRPAEPTTARPAETPTTSALTPPAPPTPTETKRHPASPDKAERAPKTPSTARKSATPGKSSAPGKSTASGKPTAPGKPFGHAKSTASASAKGSGDADTGAVERERLARKA